MYEIVNTYHGYDVLWRVADEEWDLLSLNENSAGEKTVLETFDNLAEAIRSAKSRNRDLDEGDS